MTQVESFRDGLRLYLRSGERVEADLAVCAVGVRANLDLARAASLRTDAGILVDDYLETSAAGVYAAGDVAQARDLLTGEPKTTPIWPNAVAQGKLAASNMAGRRQVYTGEVGLQNAVEFREVPAIAFGLSKATEAQGYRVRTVHHPGRGVYKKVVFDGDVPRGMIAIGDISQAGVIGSLIKCKAHLGELADRLLDEGFSIAYLTQRVAPTPLDAVAAQGYQF